MAYSLTLGRMVSGDWNLGASVTTSTEDVENKLNALRTDTNNLNVDVTSWFKKAQGRPGTKSFVDAWVRWRDDTYRFIAGWKQGFFKVKLAWGYYDNAVERMNELAKWREKWERLSGESSSAPASVPSQASGNLEYVAAWKLGLALGLGAAGALYISSKIKG